jgi:ABC-2 type transport system permease protein
MPTARTAQTVAMVLLYPMLILSGAGWPRELMPAAILKISSFLQLTYVVNMLHGLWFGESWGQHPLDIGVLAAMVIAGVLISVKTFRWE